MVCLNLNFRKILTKSRSIAIICFTVFFALIWVLTLFLSFGLCAVYLDQAIAFVLSFLFGIIFDACAFSFMTEGILGLFYLCRKSKTMVYILDFGSRSKSYKTLAP